MSYGPASGNALTVTVAQDGSLDFDSGTESVPLYKGVRWELDVPEGIVGVPLILSYTGDVPGTLVISLYANANSLGGVYQGKNNTAVTIPKGTTRVELRILRGGVTAGSVSGNLKIQLELGNTAHDWMRPDNTSLGGGAMNSRTCIRVSQACLKRWVPTRGLRSRKRHRARTGLKAPPRQQLTHGRTCRVRCIWTRERTRWRLRTSPMALTVGS